MMMVYDRFMIRVTILIHLITMDTIVHGVEINQLMSGGLFHVRNSLWKLMQKWMFTSDGYEEQLHVVNPCKSNNKQSPKNYSHNKTPIVNPTWELLMFINGFSNNGQFLKPAQPWISGAFGFLQTTGIRSLDADTCHGTRCGWCGWCFQRIYGFFVQSTCWYQWENVVR